MTGTETTNTTNTGTGEGAGANAGAAGANANAGANAGGTGATTTDWTSTLDADKKGYVQNKGFKAPSDLLESYINLEKLRGVPAERLLKKPDDKATPEEWKEFNEKLGVPKEAKEYTIPVKDGDDPDFAPWAQKTFYELGVPKAQAEKLLAKWDSYYADKVVAHQKATELKIQQTEDAFKKELGAKYDETNNKAKKTASAFGIDGPTIDKLEKSLGYSGVMKFLAAVGDKMGEADFVDNDNTTAGKFGAMSPEAARARIDAIKADPEQSKKYLLGDATLKAEMDRLHKYLQG